MTKIAIVGGGIIGLSSAICIQNSCAPDTEITLFTEKLSPHTTGDGAAGLCLPYLLGETPPENIYRWATITFNFLREIWQTEDAVSKGVSLVPCFTVTSDVVNTVPLWSNVVFGFHKMKPEQLKVFNKPSLRSGYSFVTFTCEAPKLLPHFLEIFKSRGGEVVIQKINDLKELGEEFDIVVNCTGVGANQLVPDPLVQPKRGQVMRVKAPHLKFALLDEDDIGNYFIPNQDTVVLGGTHQESDWNTKPYPEDTKFIKEGCSRIVPSLKHIPILREWVGLRPGRPTVRLETEKIGISSRGEKSFTIIHNYGHGGSGLTLFWGCGLQTAELVKEAIQQHSSQYRERARYVPKSKL